MSCDDEIEWFTLTWKIENFSFIASENIVCDRLLNSPIWYTKNTEGEKKWWLLEISCSGNNNFLSFNVHEANEYICSSYKFKMYLTSTCSNVPLLDYYIQGFTIESSLAIAIFGDKAQEILPNDTLTVCCKIGHETMKAGDFHIHSALQRENFIFKFEDYDSIREPTYAILEKNGLLFGVFMECKNFDKNIFNIDIHGLLSTCGLPCLVGASMFVEKDPIGNLLDNGKRIVSDIDINYPGLRWQIEVPNFYEEPQFKLDSIYVLHKNFPPQLPPSSINELKAVPVSSSTLSDDLLHLYRDQTLSNATLNTEGKSFSAHKSILAARSSVFRAMFEKEETTEGRSGVVNIDDIDSMTVEQLLIFLYGDSMEDIQWEEASKLYYAADKYAIQSLKEKCVCILKAGLSVSNACDALVLADTHSDQELQKCVVDFIRDHNEVVSSELWDKLEDSNPRLTSRVTRELFLKKGK